MSPAGTIYLAPLSFPEDQSIPAPEEVIWQQFGYHTKVLELYLDLSPYFNPERAQYSANEILAHLLTLVPENPHKIVGITGVDLFIPVLTFIFGQAYLGGRAAVVSGYRLNNKFYGLEENRKLFEQRLTKSILHEIGHLFGLRHCVNMQCVMKSTTYVEEIDQKPGTLCWSCIDALERLRTSPAESPQP